MTAAAPYAARPSKRLAAAAVDLVLALLASVLVFSAGDVLGATFNGGLLVLATYVGYHAVFLHFWEGQSPGRRAFEIAVIDARGARLAPLQALARPIAR